MRRPYGVGLLVAGYDVRGRVAYAHLPLLPHACPVLCAFAPCPCLRRLLPAGWEIPALTGCWLGAQVTGPHLFQTCPSGNYFEYKAIAIGARSQSAKTYLERYFQRDDARGTPGFDDCARTVPPACPRCRPAAHLHFLRPVSADDLVVHAIKALRASMHGDEVRASSAARHDRV